jgi:hypothetical protein
MKISMQLHLPPRLSVSVDDTGLCIVLMKVLSAVSLEIERQIDFQASTRRPSLVSKGGTYCSKEDFLSQKHEESSAPPDTVAACIPKVKIQADLFIN